MSPKINHICFGSHGHVWRGADLQHNHAFKINQNLSTGLCAEDLAPNEAQHSSADCGLTVETQSRVVERWMGGVR